MMSTITIDELANELLGGSITEAVDSVEVLLIAETEQDTVLLDTLLEQYLSHRSVGAISDVDFHDERAGWELRIRELQIGNMRLGYGYWRWILQGKSLLVLILIFASLILGPEALALLLQHLPCLP